MAFWKGQASCSLSLVTRLVTLKTLPLYSLTRLRTTLGPVRCDHIASKKMGFCIYKILGYYQCHSNQIIIKAYYYVSIWV
ncbi:hypothetical protein BABINDRAFT_118225 [Babjeviella inositovora NRRL Y-12698]|uniref:Uncharacterized protein n=1 Tax=Babjeviella inositovora NRRL Y-12698 TaxID=984486 RepID=A0A1E3QVE0_9ASCO|nr:uncharacterized protein BABINDRAFT_118225 [Babjeviella inositovora NRRL Y-12698]ODQ80927.1 hypothetical protein BABINDRAFT_118225 [Babjeviella inositovora NRRL Y-12698]